MRGVTIDDVTATADVTDDTATYRLREVEQKRGGQWVKIGRRHPVVVQPGGTLQLRATLAGDGSSYTVPLTLDVPKKSVRRGYLEVLGGSSSWDNGVYGAKTPAQMEEAVESMVRNDEVVANLILLQARSGQGRPRDTSDAQDLVVRGRDVRRGEGAPLITGTHL